MVEIPDDSTSSSASNSTRRASSLTNTQTPQHAPTPAKQAPTSPETDAESDFGFSPIKQQDLQHMRERSASTEGPTDLSSSPFSGSSIGSEDTGAHSVAGEDEADHSSGSEDGFDAESTAMSMDDMTAQSAVSMQSDASTSSSASARLNEALRQAAREAGTQAIDEEDGEMSMAIADQEITGAFQPWIKKGQRQSFDWEDISARHDQENIDPSKPASDGVFPESDGMDEDEDMSMDVTNAVGRILDQSSGRRQSAVRRKSSGQEANYGDETMEMTNMVGGIAQMDTAIPSDNNGDDEEMTMEFTNVVGGVITNPQHGKAHSAEQEQPDSDDGMDMEMTGAIGGILPSGLENQNKAHGKMLMELETESGQLASSPFQENVRPSPAKSPAKSPLVLQVAAVASEDGSPSLASVRSRPTRRSSALGTQGTPQSATRPRSPSKKPSTPSKQGTPQTKPTAPGKTPPSANVSFRSASPKRLFKSELQQSADKRKSPNQGIFEQNMSAGQSTPRIVLQPRERRRSSGLGIDKEGLGSPRVAALLDKRLSLGDSAPQFVPQDRQRDGVRFEDPLKMQADEERDREQEELREDGHILPPGSEERDVTSNLKDMISSLSPKKTKIGSRKSLHVGAARGILGKRPIELDLDEEEAENSPKRLRGHNVSPVKGVKLPGPAKQDARRRSMRSPVRRAASSSPPKGSETPTQQLKSATTTGATPLKEGVETLHLAPDAQQREQDEEDPVPDPADLEPIQLQDFLDMTNIHFMELTTTKRRHTTAPGSANKKSARLSEKRMPKPGTITFDDCVAAGFCTVPMLELYQHVCSNPYPTRKTLLTLLVLP